MEPAELQPRIAAHVAACVNAPVDVRALERLAGGACQDNYRVDLKLPEGDRRFALRADAASSLPRSIRRADEYRVVQAAVAAGVRTPQAQWIATDLVRPGSDSYFLDWVEGEAIGRRVVSSPKLAKAREGLAKTCAEEMAKIHTITPATLPAAGPAPLPIPPAGFSAVDDMLASLRKMLDELPQPRPATELALRWLNDHRPPSAPITLVHGDFRTGNLLVTPEGLSAVLDWEFAHWGAPDEDLAWLCVRDWRFGQLDKPVGGFAKRDDLYSAYERASGRKLSRDSLLFWEIAGNVRWAIGSLYQGERYMNGAQDDIELIAIARRAIEMEYEALRLIETGI